jgi:hypothetical protein
MDAVAALLERLEGPFDITDATSGVTRGHSS